jgi:hypothetical protein
MLSFFAAALLAAGAARAAIVLSPADRARVFEGVGGISGGGATSRLLFDYPEPQRTALLDALFSPQQGAAFQTAKVEIPADADTTCGSEVAHRHDADDGGSCTRGYEGTFLASANARRPGITSSSLQWAAPKFVSEAAVADGKSLFTATNIDEYVIPWLRCMQTEYNVTITWQGSGWNEKIHNNSYTKLMRRKLDAAGFAGTGLAAADQCCSSSWNIISDLVADTELRSAVAAVSTHCAGSMNKQDTPQAAVDLGTALFQGEEHIGLPDPDGVPVWQWPAAAATGVEINQNWVLSNMSSTVFWPAAYAWLSGLAYNGKGFVVAASPWGADAPCYIPTALWVVAHTTHFTTARASWLLNNSGSGHLTDARAPLGNGAWNISYVTYATGSDVTVVVESFLQGGEWHASRGGAAAAAAAPAQAVFQLAGDFSKWAGGALHVWHTNKTATFERLPDVAVAADGTFSIAIESGAIYTYTSVESAHPGAAAWLAKSAAAGGCVAAPELAADDLWPPESPFPLPYYEARALRSLGALPPPLAASIGPNPCAARTAPLPRRTLRATPTTRCRSLPLTCLGHSPCISCLPPRRRPTRTRRRCATALASTRAASRAATRRPLRRAPRAAAPRRPPRPPATRACCASGRASRRWAGAARRATWRRCWATPRWATSRCRSAR